LRGTDLWLMLGDNAYETDWTGIPALPDTYPAMLRSTVLWPHKS
jgi:hypothetical protein